MISIVILSFSVGLGSLTMVRLKYPGYVLRLYRFPISFEMELKCSLIFLLLFRFVR